MHGLVSLSLAQPSWRYWRNWSAMFGHIAGGYGKEKGWRMMPLHRDCLDITTEALEKVRF